MKKITIAALFTLPMLAQANGITEILGKPYLDKYGKKTCTTGKPCGNSCINRNYTCHIGEVTYTPIPTPRPTIIPTLAPIPTPAPTIIPTLAPTPTKAPTPVPTPVPAACSNVNLYAVIDGDTIYVTDGAGKMEKVRVNQIDAPERSQDYGKESKECLKDFVTNKVLEICRDGKDKYGRTLADVKANMADAGHMMVMNGCAWAYSQYLKPGSDLPSVEQSARQAKIGLWANPNPIAPWDYRHGTVPVPINATGKPAIIVSNATIAKVWDRLFDWAEHTYPEKLINGGNTESLPDGMMYRCYFPSDKIFCIGNKGDKAYNYEGTTINDLGNIQPYLDKASQEGF